MLVANKVNDILELNMTFGRKLVFYADNTFHVQ